MEMRVWHSWGVGPRLTRPVWISEDEGLIGAGRRVRRAATGATGPWLFDRRVRRAATGPGLFDRSGGP